MTDRVGNILNRREFLAAPHVNHLAEERKTPVIHKKHQFPVTAFDGADRISVNCDDALNGRDVFQGILCGFFLLLRGHPRFTEEFFFHVGGGYAFFSGNFVDLCLKVINACGRNNAGNSSQSKSGENGGCRPADRHLHEWPLFEAS